MHPPSVDALARTLADTGVPHPLLVDAARAGSRQATPDSAHARADATSARALLGPVINATGVLLHTNLGRAPLADHGPAAGAGLGPARYANLEFDLDTGLRGSRHRHAATLLARASGAEAALVVNNGAAAVLLAVTALATGRTVVVSRGELVEIGGGFRIPEVLAASGAVMVEVGTTNRTRVADYQRVIASDSKPALLLKVHRSNYRIVGFTEEASVSDLAALGVPVVVDLGSGLLDAATPWLPDGPPTWLAHEPAVRQTLAAGAALVTFSGDKLLGGPQAGVIAGDASLVERYARHPLARALRPGGLILGELQRTALAYLRRDGAAIPFWRMATAPVEALRSRAAALGAGVVVDCASVAGGGSLPGLEIPSAGIAITGDRTAKLRAGPPPIVARVVGNRTVLDLRTVDPEDDAVVANAVSALAPR